MMARCDKIHQQMEDNDSELLTKATPQAPRITDKLHNGRSLESICSIR